MELDTPQIKRALDEVEFLRSRLSNLQDSIASSLDERRAKETMVDYLHTLYALIDKEHNLYVRFSLIDSVESHLAILKLDGYKMMDLMGEVEVDALTMIYPKIKENLLEVIVETSGEEFDPEDLDEGFNIW